MTTIWRMCLQEEEKSPLNSSRHQSSIPTSALLMFLPIVQSLPLVVVNGIKWCVLSAQKRTCTDISPLVLFSHLHHFKDESPHKIVCSCLTSASPSTGEVQSCFPIQSPNVWVIVFSSANTIAFDFVCLPENHWLCFIKVSIS